MMTAVFLLRHSAALHSAGNLNSFLAGHLPWSSKLRASAGHAKRSLWPAYKCTKTKHRSSWVNGDTSWMPTRQSTFALLENRTTTQVLSSPTKPVDFPIGLTTTHEERLLTVCVQDPNLTARLMPFQLLTWLVVSRGEPEKQLISLNVFVSVCMCCSAPVL